MYERTSLGQDGALQKYPSFVHLFLVQDAGRAPCSVILVEKISPALHGPR